ncbi:YbgC/FadM family acyl-CoA thioesterase [Sulfurospirillum sp. 1307]
MKIRVYYEDTDAGGIVYHSNYLKFCERARSEIFFQSGKSPAVDGGHFVVKHIEADFIKPAKLGDLLEVKNKIIEMKNASMSLEQSIWIEDTKIFSMNSILVYVKDGKPSRVNTELKEFFNQIFKK